MEHSMKFAVIYPHEH